MAGIDEVLERLVGDSAFRRALAQDPQAALSGYDLTGEDVELLTAQLDEGSGGEHGVEQRTSKSAIAGFLAQAFSGGGGEAAESPDYEVWQSQFGEPNQASDGSHKDWADVLSVSQVSRAQGSEEPAADLTTEEPDPEGIRMLIPAVQKAQDAPEPNLDLSGRDDSSDDMTDVVTGRLTGLRSARIEDSGGGTEEADYNPYVSADYVSVDAAEPPQSGPPYAAAVASGANSPPGMTEVAAAESDGESEEADFNQSGVVDAADYVVWRKSYAPESVEDLAGSPPDDASATPKLYETAAKGTYLPGDSGDPDALTSAEAVPAAEDTAQQSGDPDQPVITGRVYNSEAGSDASATGPPDLAGSEEGSDESADGGWYRSAPTVSLGGDDAPPYGTDAAAAAIQAEGGDAVGGHEVEYEVEEGEN